MTPLHLRARAGLTLDDLARSLGMAPGEVRTLEHQPTLGWELELLRSYVRACGAELKIAVIQGGREEALE